MADGPTVAPQLVTTTGPQLVMTAPEDFPQDMPLRLGIAPALVGLGH
ncbi:hypothetical protein HMPREF1861_00018 [Corynebacterium kroppenstedtii]|nr:hypothetical protein HMPREF1861_00018 [Corynebacterium kroppenstedtii]